MTKQESSSILLREDRGPVAILTLNRPEKLNALSNELIAGIVNVLDNIEPDSSVRAVVITGAGRAFSAGADIAAFQKHMQAGPAEAAFARIVPTLDAQEGVAAFVEKRRPTFVGK